MRTITPHLLSLTRPLLQLAHSSTPIVSEGGLPVYGVLGNPSLSCVELRALCGRYATQDYLGNLKGIERKKAGVERPGRKVVGLGFV